MKVKWSMNVLQFGFFNMYSNWQKTKTTEKAGSDYIDFCDSSMRKLLKTINLNQINHSPYNLWIKPTNGAESMKKNYKNLLSGRSEWLG
jgi:hypothetical protein